MRSDRRLCRWIIIGVIIILASGPHRAGAQNQSERATSPTQGLTLSQAVNIALQTNPLIHATESKREIAAAQLSEAKTARLPLVQFSETLTRSNNPVFVFGSLLEQERFGAEDFGLDALNRPNSMTNFRTAINMRLPLFNQLQTSTRIALARIGEKQSQAQQGLIEQHITFEVIQTYYGVLVAEAKKNVAHEAVRMAESEVKRINDLFEKGLVVASDLLAMEVQLAEFRQQQIQAQGDVITAYAELNTAMGLPNDTPQTIEEQLLDRTFDVPAQEKVIQLALTHRLDYQQSLMEVQSREQDVRAATGQYLPRVDLLATYGCSGEELDSGSTDYMVAAGLTFNLINPGRRARLQQARAARELADAERQRKADEISLEVVRAHQHYLAAQERLKVAAKAVQQATETIRIVQDRHNTGLTTITEVLRAHTALVRAQMNLLSARYDYYVGYAQTLLATGQLTDISRFTS